MMNWLTAPSPQFLPWPVMPQGSGTGLLAFAHPQAFGQGMPPQGPPMGGGYAPFHSMPFDSGGGGSGFTRYPPIRPLGYPPQQMPPGYFPGNFIPPMSALPGQYPPAPPITPDNATPGIYGPPTPNSQGPSVSGGSGYNGISGSLGGPQLSPGPSVQTSVSGQLLPPSFADFMGAMGGDMGGGGGE